MLQSICTTYAWTRLKVVYLSKGCRCFTAYAFNYIAAEDHEIHLNLINNPSALPLSSLIDFMTFD